MPRYEYKNFFARTPHEPEWMDAELNRLALEGWEIITAVPLTGYLECVPVVFKRAVAGDGLKATQRPAVYKAGSSDAANCQQNTYEQLVKQLVGPLWGTSPDCRVHDHIRGAKPPISSPPAPAPTRGTSSAIPVSKVILI